MTRTSPSVALEYLDTVATSDEAALDAGAAPVGLNSAARLPIPLRDAI